jgi:two-component system response regulator AtoC
MIKDFYQIFFLHSSKMTRLRGIIHDIAKADIPVLIQGESGTGKELVAQVIHMNSMNPSKPFIKVNCAAIPKTLLESELFGFEKGAFTGAHLQKPGKFELANEGTILLNYIEEIDFSIQAKLLQVLQDGEFCRLGGDQTISVNTRVVTTTKSHLEKLMLEGQFRKDLFYRINVMTIIVPPLRDRREQILPFMTFFLNLYKFKYGRTVAALSPETVNAFQEYSWPGNIRQLENIIKRVVLFGEEKVVMQGFPDNEFKDNGLKNDIDPELFDLNAPPFPDQEIEPISLKEVGKKAAEVAEKKAIQDTLFETHWNRKEAAKLLRVSYKALLYKVQKYRLDEIQKPLHVE